MSGATREREGAEPQDLSEMLATAVQSFDEKHAKYLQTGQQAAGLPLNFRFLRMRAALEASAEAFQHVVETVVDSELGAEDQSTFLAGLILGEDSRRVEKLRQHAPYADMPKLSQSHESLSAEIAGTLKETEDRNDKIHNLVQRYMQGVSGDTRTFKKSLTDSYRGGQIAQAESIGRHIMDIGKITVGVAAGTLLARAISSKK